jgi:hypothetical protein
MVMKPLILGFLMMAALVMMAALAAAPDTRRFPGIVSDSMCPRADHSGMRMGPTDAECTIACVSVHDAAYVLYDGKDVYTLSGQQQMLEKYAAQKVTVIGTLEARTKTIRVDSITAAR